MLFSWKLNLCVFVYKELRPQENMAESFFRDPPEKAVYSWDVFEYELTDGRIHRGILVDIVEQGMNKELLVDQLVRPNSCSQILIPFHKALRFDAQTFLIARYPERADVVQVLLQTSPNVPWTWFPGKLILSDRRSFAVVQVHVPDNEQREIVVPAAHVRFDHPGMFSKRIGRDEFVKKIVRVPENFILDDEVRKRWKERFPGTKPCTLSNSSLSYLQALPNSKDENSGESGIILRDEQENKTKGSPLLSKFFHFLPERFRNIPPSYFRQPGPCSHNADMPLEEKLIKITAAMIRELMDEVQMMKKETLSNSMPAYDGSCIHNILPKEIMLKIFRLLYTEQQAKARCVCKNWNFWLQSPAFSKEARFDLCGENRYLNENDCLRKFFAYVHGILPPTCKSAVLTAGNGNVIRHLLCWETSFNPCLFDRLIKVIDRDFSCSRMFPKWDTNYPKWSTVYTIKRGGVRWSFELIIVRIYSYHGPNENALEPTVFPGDFQSKPGRPTGLRPYTILSEVQSVSPVCMSNPTRFVFTAGDFGAQHVLTWDILHKEQSDKPVPLNRTWCFEKDNLARLRISADGKVLFAGAAKTIAVLDVCGGVPRVKTVLRKPGVKSHYGSYYARSCPMVVSNEGNLCFISCVMGNVLMWDIRSGKVAARFPAQLNTRIGQCIDRSSDGLSLWTVGQGMKVRSWDTRTVTQLREMDMSGLSIYGISCCPDNEWIAIGTMKKFSYIDTVEERRPGVELARQSSVVVEIVNVSRPEKYQLEILDEEDPGPLMYSPNGAWLLATTDMELNLFHHPYGYLAYKEHMAGSLDTYYYGGCDISPDGKFVARGLFQDGVVVYEVSY